MITAKKIETELLPEFFRAQKSRMSGVRYFGQGDLITEMDDILSEASIKFIRDLRSEHITCLSGLKAYRIFAKYVSYELMSHKSKRQRLLGGRDEKQRKAPPLVSSFTSNFGEDPEGHITELHMDKSYIPDSDLEMAVHALETDPRFELLKLSALEGWGLYHIGNKEECTWKVAENKIKKQRALFIEEFNATKLV